VNKFAKQTKTCNNNTMFEKQERLLIVYEYLILQHWHLQRENDE
jgi:hypothetical protein